MSDHSVAVVDEHEPLEFDADSDEWVAGTVRTRIAVLYATPSGDSFRGVAVHGRPNLFYVTSNRHLKYVNRCIALLHGSGATRIEVRASVQHEDRRRGGSRVPRRVDPKHWDLTTAADREAAEGYCGPAVLSDIPVTVALTGHLDPIDGRFHWYGRVHADEPELLPPPGRILADLLVPGVAPVAAKLEERDPWGNLRVSGVGPPPFAV